MLSRSLAIVSLLLLQLMLPTVRTAVARTISWSGYTWNVRPGGFGSPGPNQWSDSTANVRVDGSDLLLSIVRDGSGRWTSVEVDNQQHLGYGTYRWIVASDLSALDANEVLGMFTYGGSSASNNEIDIEPSHWGNLAWPRGSATMWQEAGGGHNVSKTFEYSSRPPYVNQFTWEQGKVTYRVTDVTGATLFDWTVTSGVPTPSSEVPMINYWRFENAPPPGVRNMRISSFMWIPLGGETQPPRLRSPDTSSAGGVTNQADESGPAGQRGACVRLAMSPRRFAVTGRQHGATLRWSASRRATLRFVVERAARGQRFARVGTLAHVVRKGAGRTRFTGRLGGHRLRAGSYRLVIARGARVRCARRPLRFTVLR
jgi:hypothetical protein